MVKSTLSGDSNNKNKSQFNSNFKRNFKRNDGENFTNKLFELAAQAVRDTKERTVSFKNVFSNMQIDTKFMGPVFGIGCKVMSNWKINEELLENSGILSEHPDIDKNLLRVVVAELIWGHKKITGKGEIFDIVREKKDQLTDLFKEHEEGVQEENELKVFFARVNSLKVTERVVLTHLDEMGFKLIDTPSKYEKYLKEIMKLEPDSFMIDFHFKDLFVFNSRAKATLIPNTIVKDKLMIIQSKSSLIPVHLMDVKPGNTVLDMCAAPGMKTAIIASQLKGEGKVWAVDKDGSRYKSMIKNLSEFGAIKMTHTVNCDVLHLKSNPEDFDIILLDAPCSGSGIAGRLGETDGNPMRLRKLQWIQMKLLMHALTKYPNVKRVVYSTCSIYPDENEGVIDEVMERLKDELTYKLVDSHEVLSGFSKGSDDYKCGSSCIRVSVEEDFANGFFIAVFDKDPTKVITEDVESAETTKVGKKRKHSEAKEEVTNDEEEEANGELSEEEIPQLQTKVKQKKGKKAKPLESPPKKMKLQNESSKKATVQKKNQKKLPEVKEEVASGEEEEEGAESAEVEDTERIEFNVESSEEAIPQPQTAVKQKKGKKSKQIETSTQKMKLKNEKSKRKSKKNKRKNPEVKDKVASEEENNEGEEEDVENMEEVVTERNEDERETSEEQTIKRNKKGKKVKHIETSPNKMKLQNEKSKKTPQSKTKGKKAKKERISPEESVDMPIEETADKPLVKSKKTKQKNQKKTECQVTSRKPNGKQKDPPKEINAPAPQTKNPAKKTKRKNKKSI